MTVTAHSGWRPPSLPSAAARWCRPQASTAGSAMVIEHVNRRGDTYYLHRGKTKTGKPKFFFSRKREGTLADSVPTGYEVYENPNAQVFLRKALPRVVTDDEVATVER